MAVWSAFQIYDTCHCTWKGQTLPLFEFNITPMRKTLPMALATFYSTLVRNKTLSVTSSCIKISDIYGLKNNRDITSHETNDNRIKKPLKTQYPEPISHEHLRYDVIWNQQNLNQKTIKNAICLFMQIKHKEWVFLLTYWNMTTILVNKIVLKQLTSEANRRDI